MNSFIVDPYFSSCNNIDEFKDRVIRTIDKYSKKIGLGKKIKIGYVKDELENLSDYKSEDLFLKENHYVILDPQNIIESKIKYAFVRNYCLDKNSYKCKKNRKGDKNGKQN